MPLQALVVSTVAQLMDGDQPGKGSTGGAADSFVTIDPMLQASKSTAEAQLGAVQEAIVFIVGGGNYLERERLVQWGNSCTPKRGIIYGSTELLTGKQFCEQLAVLGRRSQGVA